MERERATDRDAYSATQTNDSVNSQRLARELGQLIGKSLAEQPPKNKISGVKRRLGVDAEFTIDTIIQTGQIGDAVVGHSNDRRKDPDSDSENPLCTGPPFAARNADQDGRRTRRPSQILHRS